MSPGVQVGACPSGPVAGCGAHAAARHTGAREGAQNHGVSKVQVRCQLSLLLSAHCDTFWLAWLPDSAAWQNASTPASSFKVGLGECVLLQLPFTARVHAAASVEPPICKRVFANKCLSCSSAFVCRFPIQLELLEPAEAIPFITKPQDYQPAANVGWCYDQGWDIKKVRGSAAIVCLTTAWNVLCLQTGVSCLQQHGKGALVR